MASPHDFVKLFGAWAWDCKHCCHDDSDAVTTDRKFTNEDSTSVLFDEGLRAVTQVSAVTQVNAQASKLPCAPLQDPALEHRTEVVMANGTRYTGQWRGARCHGQGKLTRTDGSVYDGAFLDGLEHGYGRFQAAGGWHYQGEWRRGHAEGFGSYTDTNGSTYQGEWHDDRRHGDGEEAWCDGSKYLGQYSNDKKHGSGHFMSATGETFQGQLVDDRMEGEGTYCFDDGRRYAGQWRGGAMHGNGVMQLPDGRRSEGRWCNGRLEERRLGRVSNGVLSEPLAYVPESDCGTDTLDSRSNTEIGWLDAESTLPKASAEDSGVLPPAGQAANACSNAGDASSSEAPAAEGDTCQQ